MADRCLQTVVLIAVSGDSRGRKAILAATRRSIRADIAHTDDELLSSVGYRALGCRRQEWLENEGGVVSNFVLT